MQHLIHGDYASTGEVLAVLVHLNGFQPFWHRPEGGAVRTTGARQANGHPRWSQTDPSDNHQQILPHQSQHSKAKDVIIVFRDEREIKNQLGQLGKLIRKVIVTTLFSRHLWLSFRQICIETHTQIQPHATTNCTVLTQTRQDLKKRLRIFPRRILNSVWINKAIQFALSVPKEIRHHK